MSGGLNWFLDLSGDSPQALPAPSAPAAPVAAFRPGHLLADRFELIEQLGAGGMGVVYHARELASGRSVAIKLTHGQISAKQRERFRREGVVTAAIRHPGIVLIYGAGELDGSPYLVCEYVPGGRTFRDLQDEEVPREQLLAALRDAAAALGAAHALGVVHRDVKPSNLLITPDGRVRVADFGLARGAEMQALTKTGEMLGTPHYMPLEQFDGEREAVAATADVWALGVILHEVIVGATPFESCSLAELIGSIQHARIDPRKLAPDLEPQLEAICLRALERAPADRYPDGAAFAADLSRFLRGEPSATRGRFRRAVAALGAAALVLFAALGLLVTRGEGSRSALADSELELAAGESGDGGAWRSRLAHATRAAALDPTRAARARRLEARALLELGRYEQAAAAYAGGGDPALLLEGATLLAGCSRWKQADALLASYRSITWAPPRADRAVALLAAEIEVGLEPERASLDRAKGELGASAMAILEAQLALATGSDAGAILRARVAARPKDTEVAEALVRLHLERAEFAVALVTLEHAKTEGLAPPPLLEETLAALRAGRVEPARRLPRSWKLSAGRGAARLARRELDLARQDQDPRYESDPKALAPALRLERAERYLAFVRDELAHEGLIERHVERSNPAAGLLARARELLKQGAPERCLAALDEYTQLRDYDLGSYDELVRLVDELALALPGGGERLRALTTPPVAEALRERYDYSAAPRQKARGPYDWSRLYDDAASPELRSDAADRCLRTWVLATSRAPRLLRHFTDDLFRFSRSSEMIAEPDALEALAARVTGSTWLDRLARVSVQALVVQFEGGAPTTVELDSFLDEFPGVVFVRVLRVMVLVRAGRTVAAREDLAVLAELHPGDLQTTALARALLLAREGAPAHEVLAALEHAKTLGFHVGEGWQDTDFPELVRYRQDPSIRTLLTR